MGARTFQAEPLKMHVRNSRVKVDPCIDIKDRGSAGLDENKRIGINVIILDMVGIHFLISFRFTFSSSLFGQLLANTLLQNTV